LTNFNKFGIVERGISWATRINQNTVNLVEFFRARGLLWTPWLEFKKKNWIWFFFM